MTFGEQLRELRKERGLTQTELARHVGLSQQAIGKWESGISGPDLEMLQFLADYFGVSMDRLFGRPEPGVRPIPWTREDEVAIPVVGAVKAGYNGVAFQEDLGSEPATVRHPEDYFYLIVRGDSMEPRISSGDLALVHQQPDVENGELAVVLVDGEEGTLKKVIKKQDAVILQPFNPKYQAQIFMGKDLERLSIVGRVVETKSKW